MKTTLVIFIFLAIHQINSQECKPSATTASGTLAQTKICSGALIFEDNFDTLDSKKWKHESTLGGGGNWEFQWYTPHPQNSAAVNGTLKIKATLTKDFLGEEALNSSTINLNQRGPTETCTNSKFYGCLRTGTPKHIINSIRSAQISTIDSFSFKYGRLEIRAKPAAGDWLISSLWMSPKVNVYGIWPRSGTVNLADIRGNRKLVLKGKKIGVQNMTSTMHWGPDSTHNDYWRTKFSSETKKGFNRRFHKYEVLWTPDSMTFRIDGNDIGSVKPPAGGFWQYGKFVGPENIWKSGSKMAPFDHEFYIIMNLAVGGIAMFPDDASNPGGKPWLNTSPQAGTDFWDGRDQWMPTWKEGRNELKVDYVRVYAL